MCWAEATDDNWWAYHWHKATDETVCSPDGCKGKCKRGKKKKKADAVAGEKFAMTTHCRGTSQWAA
jgi:hypothetical protein